MAKLVDTKAASRKNWEGEPVVLELGNESFRYHRGELIAYENRSAMEAKGVRQEMAEAGT